MTFGSLFAGIGGMDLGLERAGMVCRWQVEIDPFCQSILKKHWPEVPKYGDIKEITELESVDIIAGGFPCQDISIAGRGAGISGPRSGLWREMLRTYCLVRPRFLLVENVAALLNRGMGSVLGDLAESGADAEWGCVSTSQLGSPSKRERVFILAYSAVNRLEGHIGSVIPQVSQDRSPQALDAWNTSSSPFRDWGKLLAESRIIRVPGGFAKRLDKPKERLRVIGNSVSPQVAEWIGRRLISAASYTEIS